MRITSKGQVTIPQEIRRRLGLQPETEVEFAVVGNTVRIRKLGGRPGRGRGIIERLRGRATTRLTTDQILALTRG
jgi:AbrB family looped-hinge helix DNA binding protein